MKNNPQALSVMIDIGYLINLRVFLQTTLLMYVCGLGYKLSLAPN